MNINSTKPYIALLKTFYDCEDESIVHQCSTFTDCFSTIGCPKRPAVATAQKGSSKRQRTSSEEPPPLPTKKTISEKVPSTTRRISPARSKPMASRLFSPASSVVGSDPDTPFGVGQEASAPKPVGQEAPPRSVGSSLIAAADSSPGDSTLALGPQTPASSGVSIESADENTVVDFLPADFKSSDVEEFFEEFNDVTESINALSKCILRSALASEELTNQACDAFVDLQSKMFTYRNKNSDDESHEPKELLSQVFITVFYEACKISVSFHSVLFYIHL